MVTLEESHGLLPWSPISLPPVSLMHGWDNPPAHPPGTRGFRTKHPGLGPSGRCRQKAPNT